ncbi:sugar phosphate isomerase/epimerase [Candidatus Woesearchaeota archaeon]|jgi:hypothetical protein|nr:sugar phosphate isomerase/epimerase [Candidatus Woesearchaeota archaeon]
MSELPRRFKSIDTFPLDMVEGKNESRKLGKASETVFFNEDGSVKSISYDFDKLVPKGFQSRVLFDANGDVIHPIKSTEIEEKLRVLSTGKISRNMDYDFEFDAHKGEDVHIYMPQGKEMYGLEHYIIRRFLDEDNINPTLIHGPGVDVTHREFLGALAFMKGNYGADTITLHPLKGDYGIVKEKLEACHDDIARLGVKIAYENMDAKDRWLTFPQEIVQMDLPNIGLTLDTSHLSSDTDLSALLDQVFEKLLVVHLSNQSGGKKHLPYNSGEMNLPGFLSALKSNGYKGSVVLEYRDQYQDQVNDDIKRVQDLLS